MELVKQNQMPFADMKQMGEVFAASGMFADTKAAAQAIVKIQAGQEIGIGPFAAMSGIHIIQGKPTMGAGLMASCVKGSGKYDYKVVKHDKKVCEIDFYHGKEKIGTSTFTDVDAKAAGTKNMDKFPQNMLFARAMSNGVKWYTPDIFMGPVYTPEEMGDVVIEDIAHEEIKPTMLPGELASFIDGLQKCDTKKDLTDYKKIVPAYIVADASFVDAAMKRYNVVMATAAIK
jgi:hypothetical protein